MLHMSTSTEPASSASSTFITPFYQDSSLAMELDLTMPQDDLLLSSLSRSASSTSLSQYALSSQTTTPLLRSSAAYTTTTTTIITTTTTTTTTTVSTPPASPTIASAGPLPFSSQQQEYQHETSSESEDDDDQYIGLLAVLQGFRLVSEGPYLYLFDVPISLYYPIRALVLFVLGFVFSLIVDHLQTSHHLVEYPNNISQLWETASWLPPTCGLSAVLIGTVYPLGDYLWWGGHGRRIVLVRGNRDWSSVMRCVGGFIGVNYAASKLPWTSSLQISCTLALISIGLWFWFDRTFHGFMISLIVAAAGTTVAYYLVLHGWYSFTRADFFGVGSWIPCILYSSSVCFGNIGRQLDIVPETWYSANTSAVVPSLHPHQKLE